MQQKKAVPTRQNTRVKIAFSVKKKYNFSDLYLIGFGDC